jgi:preprotein translocase subunit SecD
LKGNKLKLITEILAILVICLVSFLGVYKQSANRMENQVKNYEFGKDLKGYRELVFEVSDATEVTDSNGKVVGDTDSYTDSSISSYSYQKTDKKVNPDEELKLENYEKAKSIIEARLKNLQVEDYNIGMDKDNGKIYLQLPEDNTTDHTVSNLLQVANFAIKDSEDNSKVFITNEDIKNVSAVYNNTSAGTTVYLQIEFNKEGKNKLKQISTGEYATKKETENKENNENTNTEDENAVEGEAEVSTENNENTENEDNTSKEDTQKKIILSIDNNDMITTSFDTPIEDGIIDLSMNQATNDTASISETLQSASTIALIVNSGKMPLTYKISANNYINTDISQDMIQKVIYVVVIIVVISLILLILKHKSRGFISAVAYIGFVALYLLLVRYTNVAITIESIVAGIIMLAINYILICRLAKINEKDEELKDNAYLNEFKSAILKLMPIFIIAVVFAFIEWTKISTFGMVMFWGILLSVVYNYIITREMLD